MKIITIQGKVVFQNIEMGFWAIIGNDGKEWYPVNMPEQLKVEGKEISIKATVLTDVQTTVMWGTPIRITTFHT